MPEEIKDFKQEETENKQDGDAAEIEVDVDLSSLLSSCDEVMKLESAPGLLGSSSIVVASLSMYSLVVNASCSGSQVPNRFNHHLLFSDCY
jgi:hypothetical protein